MPLTTWFVLVFLSCKVCTISSVIKLLSDPESNKARHRTDRVPGPVKFPIARTMAVDKSMFSWSLFDACALVDVLAVG